MTDDAPLVTEEDAARHKAKMEKRKVLQDAKVAQATGEKGLLMVHTGKGKGKSTAAFGLILRAIGHGYRVGLVQFFKGTWETGEKHALTRLYDLLDHHVMGEGFTWDTQDLEQDLKASRAAWAVAARMMADPAYSLVVLDELNIVLRYKYLDVDQVVATLAGRRPDLHVLVTGRNAPPALVEAADLVTDFVAVKHPFEAGIKAQKGIEY